MGLKADIEAILFVCGDPVSAEDIAAAMGIDEAAVRLAAKELENDCAAQERGVRVRELNGKFQLCSCPECAPAIEKLLSPEKNKSFSQSVLETLSIIAYKQPVTRAEIEEIRGVRCEYSISRLIQTGMIEEIGRKETVGRPALLGTTEKFLAVMNISSIDELPYCTALEMLEQEPEQTEFETI